MRAVRLHVVLAAGVEGDDLLREVLGAHVGVVPVLGDVEVVEIDRVLRVVVAPRVALRAVDARRLQRAVAVAVLLADRQRIVEVIAEEHVDVEHVRRAAVGLRHLLKQLRPDHAPPRVAALRDRTRAEHLFGHGVVRLEIRLLAGRRPAVVEDLVGRPQEDVRVNQRSAEACAEHRVHFLKLRTSNTCDLGASFRPRCCSSAGSSSARSRAACAETRHRVAFAAFEHEHVAGQRAQPARVDAAAKPGADHDCFDSVRLPTALRLQRACLAVVADRRSRLAGGVQIDRYVGWNMTNSDSPVRRLRRTTAAAVGPRRLVRK